MRKVAYLSTTGLEGFFVYDALTHAPLAARGISVETIPWREEAVDWSCYEAVVIRSTWDYQRDPGAFLRALGRIGAATVLHNRLDVVRWNLDKRYLLELRDRDVPIVPTTVVDGLTTAALHAVWTGTPYDELVFKPTVSANADDTFRVRVGDERALRRAFDRLGHRATLVQPFVPSIESEGEISLFYFDGTLSHAIRKTPASGDFRVQEEHGGRLERVEPGATLAEAGERALAALPPDLLYARLDFVRLPDGAFGLMEAELIEPSLYFQFDEGAADRFAEALVRRLG